MCCLLGRNIHPLSGTPIAGGSKCVAVRNTSSNARGDFSHTAGQPLPNRCFGSQIRALTVALDANHDLPVHLALERLDSPNLRQIGQVTVDGRLAGRRDESLGRDPLGPRSTRCRLHRHAADLNEATFARPDGATPSAIAVKFGDSGRSLTARDPDRNAPSAVAIGSSADWPVATANWPTRTTSPI
jgi:hypothetical protein